MRTDEERIDELHRRIGALKQKRRRAKYRILCISAFAACLAVAVVFAFTASGTMIFPDVPAAGGLSASIFAGGTKIGYILTAVLSFCLGISFTVFCLRLRKHTEETGDDRKI